MGERQDAGARADDAGGGRQVQGAGVVDRDELHDGAGPGRQLLPGDQVGVVLHLRDHEFVARGQGEPGRFGCGAGQGRVEEGVREQVQALRGVGGPDQFVPLRPDEVRHRFPGVFEGLGGLDGEVVRPAVDRRVPLLIELLLGLEHAERVLRGGPGVQVDEGPAVDVLLQDREVVADPQDLFVSERGGRAAEVGWGGNHGGDSWIGVRCGVPRSAGKPAAGNTSHRLSLIIPRSQSPPARPSWAAPVLPPCGPARRGTRREVRRRNSCAGSATSRHGGSPPVPAPGSNPASRPPRDGGRLGAFATGS